VYLHNILFASYILFSLVQGHLQLYMYACFILSGVHSFLVILTCFSVVHALDNTRSQTPTPSAGRTDLVSVVVQDFDYTD